MADRVPLSVGVTTQETDANPVKLHILMPDKEVSGQAELGVYALV